MRDRCQIAAELTLTPQSGNFRWARREMSAVRGRPSTSVELEVGSASAPRIVAELLGLAGAPELGERRGRRDRGVARSSHEAPFTPNGARGVRWRASDEPARSVVFVVCDAVRRTHVQRGNVSHRAVAHHRHRAARAASAALRPTGHNTFTRRREPMAGAFAGDAHAIADVARIDVMAAAGSSGRHFLFPR